MIFIARRLEGWLIAVFLLVGMGLFWPPESYFGKPGSLAGGPSSSFQIVANSALLALLAIGGVLRRAELLRLLRNAWPVLLLVAVAVLSVFWSDATSLSLRRATVDTAATLFGVYLLTRYDLGELAAIMVKLTLLTAVASLVMILFYPDLAINKDETYASSLWRGAFGHKQELGFVSALGIIFSAYCFARGRGSRSIAIIALLANAALLQLSGSKTALVSLFVAISVAIFTSMLRRRDRFGLLAAYGLALVGLAGAAWVAYDLTDALGILNRNPTLTSRTQIWHLATAYADRRPWLGYGVDAFWRIGGLEAHQIQTALKWPVPDAHSAWLETRLGLGWLGLSVMILAWLVAGYRVAQTFVRDQGTHVALCGALLAALFIETLTESTWFNWSIHWVLFVVCITHLGRAATAYHAAARSRAEYFAAAAALRAPLLADRAEPAEIPGSAQ